LAQGLVFEHPARDEKQRASAPFLTPDSNMATPQHLLVIDLETRPDTAILPADRDPTLFPKPIQHEIVTLGFLLARIERDG
jgi:hypothetical protein